MSAVHVVTLDWSPTSGTIAACTCSLVLGPFNDYAEARSAAVEHRRWTGGEVVGSVERRIERNRESAARRWAEKRAARAAEAEGRS